MPSEAMPAASKPRRPGRTRRLSKPRPVASTRPDCPGARRFPGVSIFVGLGRGLERRALLRAMIAMLVWGPVGTRLGRRQGQSLCGLASATKAQSTHQTPNISRASSDTVRWSVQYMHSCTRLASIAPAFLALSLSLSHTLSLSSSPSLQPFRWLCLFAVISTSFCLTFCQLETHQFCHRLATP